MPTSPRDLTDRTGGMIRTNHPLWPRTFRADVGIRPYAGGRFLPLNLARPILSCVPSTPADKRAAPSPGRRGQELFVLGFRKIYGLSHSSWPDSLGGLGSPHPSGPMALPPSPWGKATSGGGCSTPPTSSFPPLLQPPEAQRFRGTDHYISCRPSRARDRVTSSAYSSWLPTGTP